MLLWVVGKQGTQSCLAYAAFLVGKRDDSCFVHFFFNLKIYKYLFLTLDVHPKGKGQKQTPFW